MVVDASVWIAAYLASEIHHRGSAAFLMRETHAGNALHVPALALAEIAGAIARRTGSADRAEATLSLMLSLPNLSVHAVATELALKAAGMAGIFSLRGGDAIYVALAHDLGQSLVTLDREMMDRGGRAIAVHPPD